MIKDYFLSNKNIIMNFSKKYCVTETEVLSSKLFKQVLDKYLDNLRKSLSPIILYYDKSYAEIDNILIELFQILLAVEIKDVEKISFKYYNIIQNKNYLIDFVEGLYNFWRKLSRYGFIIGSSDRDGIQNINFLSETDKFNNLILKTYRTIIENIKEEKFNIYRQLPAGINAGMTLYYSKNDLPTKYKSLNNIPFINSIVIRPPFIIKSYSNKREGTFTKLNENPIDRLNITKTHYFCYPAFIGESLAYIYFHREFMHQGIALANLLELAKVNEVEKRKPDLILVFGGNDGCLDFKEGFYQDEENDLIIGYTNKNINFDYFGYMKKMALTLHNTKMILSGKLPIHGAFISITLTNGSTKNIVLIGDSGAGKSETIEALRELNNPLVKNIKIIFDDMGSFEIKNNQVVGKGTETGAFVRLDDLDVSYAYQEIDRTIYINPDKVNARVIIPVTNYNEIIYGHKVDMVLYANNYILPKKNQEIIIFENKEEALKTFIAGKRFAKATTEEQGLSETFFSNPFGPVQFKEETTKLLKKYFDQLYQSKVLVGEIYTSLGIEKMEKEGPKKAAEKLVSLLNK